MQAQQRDDCIFAPTNIICDENEAGLEESFQVSAHNAGRAMVREIRVVFTSAVGGGSTDEFVIVQVMQRAQVDITLLGDAQEREKDRLLERFVDWAKRFVERLSVDGSWADYCDPCSGLPWFSDGNVVYSEVEGASRTLGYATRSVDVAGGIGACSVLVHPEWGGAVYPTTVFTNASPEAVCEAIQATPVVVAEQ